MSAINIIPFGSRVAIFTDAAVYSPAGVLQEIDDKCFVSTNGKLAIGGRGNHGFAKLIADLVSDRGWDLDAVADDDGALLDRMYAGAETAMTERAGKSKNDVFLVGWSEREGAVRTAFWSSMTSPRFSVGSALSAWIGPELTPAQIDRAKVAAKAAGMDIGVFGLTLVKIQRMEKGDPMLAIHDRHTIGGHVLRTDVSADGITQRIVHRWPEDRIGAPIMPLPELDPVSHPNVTALPANRAERRRLEKLQRRSVA